MVPAKKKKKKKKIRTKGLDPDELAVQAFTQASYLGSSSASSNARRERMLANGNKSNKT